MRERARPLLTELFVDPGFLNFEASGQFIDREKIGRLYQGSGSLESGATDGWNRQEDFRCRATRTSNPEHVP